jgi:hypothetical protein
MEDPGSETLSQNIMEESRYFEEHPFKAESKQRYYHFIETYGTHFLKEISLGAKAELRWSFKEKAGKDALTTVTKNQKHRKMFHNRWDSWEKLGFRTISQADHAKMMPKHCSETKKLTPNFLKVNPQRFNEAVPIGVIVQEISSLFNPTVKNEIDLAIRVYIEEMKPRRDQSGNTTPSTSFLLTWSYFSLSFPLFLFVSFVAIRDGMIVGIYCLDEKTFVRVDDHGHLFADLRNISQDGRFEVRKKGNRIGFKSLLYDQRYLSSALTRSYFSFHRLQVTKKIITSFFITFPPSNGSTCFFFSFLFFFFPHFFG